MPIYEYECTSCGHQLESFQKLSDEPLKECPHCHLETLNKLVSATTFQLKGTGWYKTDFSNKGKPPETADKKTDKVSEEKSTQGKSQEGSKEAPTKEKTSKDTSSNSSTSSNNT